MKMISDIVIAQSKTRRRGDGKPAVIVLFNKIVAWYIPSYDELKTIIDYLVKIDGKEEVERELGIKIGGNEK